MMLRFVSTCTLLGAAVLSSLTAIAQEPAQQQEAVAPQQEAVAPQQPDAAEPGLQPIDEGEISSRAELVSADLLRIETLIEPAADIARLEVALGTREADIVVLRSALDAVNPEQVSDRRLDDLRLPWLSIERELAAWRSTTGARFEELQRERIALRETRAQWELTLERAQDDTEAITLEQRQRVADVVARVIDTESRVRARRNAVDAISDRIASSQEVVSGALRRIDSIAAAMRERLLIRDAVPVWRSLGTLEARPLAADASVGAREWLWSIIAYGSLHPGRTVLLAVWFLALLAGALQLRRQSSGRSAVDIGSERVRELIRRPFSLAIASTLALSMLLLSYPVGSAADVLIVLAAVPIVRLGSVVLEGNTRRVLYGLVSLLVLGRVADLGPDGSPVRRLLLLFVAGAAFAGAVIAVRYARSAAAQRVGWPRTRSAVAAVTASLLGVGLAANALGWLRLSQMLTEATIVSLFSALAWMVIVMVASALLPAVISGRLGLMLPSLRQNQASVQRVAANAFGFVASALWLRGALIRFRLRDAVVELASRVAASEFSIGSLTISTGGIVGALIVLVVTWLTAGTIRFFVREEVLPRLSIRRGDAASLLTLTDYTVYGLGIVLAASAAGLSGTQVAVVAGALSVGIGFGLQTIVSNFVSGLILIFERPIKVGDTLQLPGYEGRVKRIGIRASTIRSFDGAEIIVPNADLIAKEVINWTGTDEIRRVEVLVGVAYGTDPETVLDILLRVAQEHPKVLTFPKPVAQMVLFGESSLDFRLRFWAPIEDWVDIASDLRVAVNNALGEARITIPFPQRDLHLRSPVASVKEAAREAIDTER